ncbi:MAG: site-specific DNA-methyltransferase [Bacteroidales bacterium]|jgi:modification methylase|nr:site-specific DNA-methyltransferase [Bacteroidales bacterium]
MNKPINEIIQGNTLDVLKTIESNFIDLSITSPPYNKQEKQKGWLVKNVKYDKFRDVLSEDEYQEEQIKVLNELYRITKPGGSLFYNHKIRWDIGQMYHPFSWLEKSLWTIRQEIIWDRMIAANIRGWRFWQVDERIYWLYKPINNNKIGEELESRHALLTSIWRFSPERNNPHPAPFPITLPVRIISSILNDNDAIVLDPYSGSGTTLVAAQLLGKKYLGIDISEEYIQYSNNRLLNSVLEKKEVEKELEKHLVQKTFKQRKTNGENVGKFQTNIQKEEKIKFATGKLDF